MTEPQKTVGLSEIIETVADQGVKIATLTQQLANLANGLQNMHSQLTFVSQVVKYTVQDQLEYTTEYKIAQQVTQPNHIKVQWTSDPDTMAMVLLGEEYVNGQSNGPVSETELTNKLKMEIIKCAIQASIPADTDFYLTRHLVPVPPMAVEPVADLDEEPVAAERLETPVEEPEVDPLEPVQLADEFTEQPVSQTC